MAQDQQARPELPPGPARELADLFGQLQRASSLSAGQLARKTGLSRSYLSEVLRGLKTPRPDKAAVLARALGADSDRVQRARRLAEDQAELNSYNRRNAVKAFPQPDSEQHSPGTSRRGTARSRAVMPGVVSLAAALIAIGTYVARIGPGSSFLLTGSVTCESGRDVVGIWIAASAGQQDSGYAHLGTGAIGTAGATGATTSFSYRLPHGGPYVVHAGCGGIARHWTSVNFSGLLSGRAADLRCDDPETTSPVTSRPIGKCTLL
jgi:transcriptional regulator with XRE-family HTH domain